MGAAEPIASREPSRHPLVGKILSGSAQDSIRLTAARGALPLPQQDLLYVQVSLLKDGVPDIAEAAKESLDRIAGDALQAIVRDPGCDPIVLDHFAGTRRLEGATLEAVIAHPSILDTTLELLAASAPAEALNLIVTNEVRIIRSPHLLETLRANPNLSGDDRRRLAELERDFIGKEQLRVRPAAVEDFEALPPSAAGVPPATEETSPEGAPVEETELPPLMSEEEQAKFEEALTKTPAFQKIMKMNVAERLQLAMKGNAEERAILVRDTARMVAQGVLKSPKLSDNEITVFASMRNVTEDILRTIAQKKEWTKTYSTVHALVRNPKTPPGLTLQFLPRLGTRDLKIVAGDKNIPELVRRQARNLFLARTQPPKKGQKKAH